MAGKPITFISCGQRSDAERQLGTDMGKLVRDLTPFEPYFAEYQTSLEGLSKHVFGALDRCVGLIVVLHNRGTVHPANLIRASVWVEQEIAIAAFLQQVLGRTLHVAAFTEGGVAREGVRESLLLNPKEFRSNDEVLDHLRLILPSWKAPERRSGTVDLAIRYKEKRITQERHDYELLLFLTNRGTQPIERYHVDLEFPLALLEQPRSNVRFVPERCTAPHGFFRVTQDAHRRHIFPGDSLQILSVEYFVDNSIFFERQELLRQTVRATLYLQDGKPEVFEKSMAELQVFCEPANIRLHPTAG